jgi:alkanesulfonate monooxygenase SsuD/methylene tetrahydromethanopterin reductase-like flavin-dependent oxidoreductase (luciferase family)
VLRALEDSGRDPETFTISKRVYLAVDENEARAQQRLRAWFGVRYKDPMEADRVALWGSAAKCVEKLHEFIAAGAEHLLLNPIMEELEQIEQIAEEIRPHL